MATTTIPWGDGSGDNIYLTYSSASGDQTVEVSSDANTGSARTKVVTFTSGVGNITQQLTVSQEQGGPQEYTLIKYPSSFDADHTVVRAWATGNYAASAGYDSGTANSEARGYLVTGSYAETFIYWKFDLSSIPDNATINSITISARARRSAGGIVSSCYLVVCDGTTQKGTTSTVSGSTAATFSLDAGSGWTGASIKNLSLLFYAKRSTTNPSTTSYFLGFYGATLTVKYSV